MPDLPIPIAAITRLNAHARANGDGRSAVYTDETFAAITLTQQGIAKRCFVVWPGKCPLHQRTLSVLRLAGSRDRAMPRLEPHGHQALAVHRDGPPDLPPMGAKGSACRGEGVRVLVEPPTGSRT